MAAARLTFSTGTVHTLPFERGFALAAEHGFDGVEHICAPDRGVTDVPLLRRLMERYNIAITSLHAPVPGWDIPGWDPDPAAEIAQTVALAEQVGAEHVAIHLPERVWFPEDGQGGYAVEPSEHGAAIKAWMDAGGLGALQAGTAVQICVENLPLSGRRPDVPDYAWWNTLDEWPTVHDYLTLDTTHWATRGVAPLEAYRAGNRRVRHIHLSNYLNGEQHQLPQVGELDIAGFLRQLVHDGFDGHVVLELNPGTVQADDPAALHRNLHEAAAFCRAALDGV